MTTDYHSLDELDRQILRRMLKNGREKHTEIAVDFGVSPATISNRLKEMGEAGIVIGSRIVLDYHKLGYNSTAFVGIYLVAGSHRYEAVEELKNIPEITEIHYTSGPYGLFTRIVCRDTPHMVEVLQNRIESIPGIQRVETFISMDQMVERPVDFLS